MLKAGPPARPLGPCAVPGFRRSISLEDEPERGEGRHGGGGAGAGARGGARGRFRGLPGRRALQQQVRSSERPLYLGRSGRRQIGELASNWTIVDMLMRRLGQRVAPLGCEAERGQIHSRRSMKMLWKLTDNIKYEDCEVSAALAQSFSRPQAPSSTSRSSSSPRSQRQMRVGQTFGSAAPASPTRPKNAGEKLEREDKDAPFFHVPPSKPLFHFSLFLPDQF